MVVLFFSILRDLILLPKVVALINIPAKCRSVPFSPHSHQPFVCVINDCHFDWSGVESQCHLDLHFLYGKGCSCIGHLSSF
jgi:hypothetical protein